MPVVHVFICWALASGGTWSETTLILKASYRILDLFFTQGRKVLFQIALAIFKLNEECIIEDKDSPIILKRIRDNMYEKTQQIFKVFAND
jgi:hypothetical protein